MIESIVVGTDGSAAATAAVKWAADDAARRGLPLRIVHALDRRPYDIVRHFTPGWLDHLTRAGEQVLAEATKVAGEREPNVRVTAELVEGVPAKALREQADGANTELVIGDRGLGGFAGALRGSMGVHTAGHVPGPVVVVRQGADESHGEIVVGIDGSVECEAALGFAFEEARLRECALRAVYAWQLPVHAFAPEISYDMDEVKQAQYRVAIGQLAAWWERFPEVTVVEDVKCAPPVPALVHASTQADLMVLGSRGRGAVGSVILGSISRGVLHHAHCHVAVVR